MLVGNRAVGGWSAVALDRRAELLDLAPEQMAGKRQGWK
jgi:hypothetical protein